MPATTPSGARVPTSTDPNNVPGDLAAYDASKDPRLTTAQIAAKPWSEKPAGWTAYDTTLGCLVRSTGAAMVAVLDAARAIADIVTGVTDANGDLSIPLPTSPTGRWAFASSLVIAAPGANPATLALRSATGTGAIVTLRIASAPAVSTPVTVSYVALAY